MSSTSAQLENPINDVPVVQPDAVKHVQREQGSLEKLEHIYNSFQYGMSKSITDGLDEKLSGIKRDFNAGQAVGRQGEDAVSAYIDNTQKTIEAMLDASTLSKVKQALEKNAEDLHAAYARGDYHAMGSMTGAVVLASMDPDKLKQLKRFTEVADGAKHVDDVAAGAVKNVGDIKDKAQEIPKAYAHDMEPSKAHDSDLMRGRQTGPVTINDTVYESGKPPRKLGPDERHTLSLVDKEEVDPTEVLKPRQSRQVHDTAPVKTENEHLGLKAGVGIITFAGLAFGAIKYYEAQRDHRRELMDAYSLAVNVTNYADNPQDRLNRYTATVQKYPELEGAIKLFEGARVSAAKDGFNYQEVEALKRVAANTTESIRNNELATIAVPNQDDVANKALEMSR